MPPDRLPCWIYRSSRKAEMYLYVTNEDDFNKVPSDLLERFGTPEFVMQLDLHDTLNLARENINTVMSNLAAQGFHLQLPPKLEPYLYEGD